MVGAAHDGIVRRITGVGHVMPGSVTSFAVLVTVEMVAVLALVMLSIGYAERRDRATDSRLGRHR
jgi:hypothetical protein